MSNTSNNTGQIISLPKGGGALHGIGEKFSPDLHTGTGNFTIPIALPPGRNGFQPQLSLGYSTGNGQGPFGLGWGLSIPGVSRKTSHGIPRYNEASAPLRFGERRDVFILSGSEDLVLVSGSYPGKVQYRPRTEGLFALIEHEYSSSNNFWKVSSKDGLISYYGKYSATANGNSTVVDPTNPNHIFAWKLTETRDPFGNRIVYEYERDTGTDGPHQFNQVYLKSIQYVDYTDQRGAEQFLVSVTFDYDEERLPNGRPGGISDYRAGFEIRTRRRCKKILIRTHPEGAAQPISVRAYEFHYEQDQHNGVSLMKRVEVVGFDDRGQEARELPPLEFGYTRFEPLKRKFEAVTGSDLPARSLANPELELVDLFGNGLPDVLEMNGSVRYWRNLGGGKFDLPRQMRAAPPYGLSDPGVQMIDANGDGRADLLVTTAETAGYYPLDFTGQFSRRSYQPYQQAPSFNLKDPEVRLIDLTGDGVTDALRSATSFECYFNDPKKGWLRGNTARIQRAALPDFPNVNFSDPRVKWGDMTGDGMQDVVLVYDGNIEYWPNLGYGRWGKRIHMFNSPRFRDLGYTFGYDPKRILTSDVDGDGLADIVYVGDRKVTLWINQSGNAWSDPIEIQGTPPVTDMDAVRLVDLFGTGVSGLLWSADAQVNGRPHMFFLDFTGGVKPYLLNKMDNNIGAVTTVQYAPSTKFYLRDAARPNTRWKTTLPFPVQVVERVRVRDELSGGALTTEYRYHHGYWDGVEREFRGFGMVEQLDTEVFDGYIGRGLPNGSPSPAPVLNQQMFSPPLLTRTWFHQGPVDRSDDGYWREFDWSPEYWRDDPNLLEHTEKVNDFLASLPPETRREALRTLRGSILRSELYALDDSLLQERPYTVTEQAYSLREEEKPAPSSTRTRIFFPHSIAQRTTQWERGDDPMTQFSFTGDYDEYGQPCKQVAVACPRGWRNMGDQPGDGYIATLAVTTFADDLSAGSYMHDRVARSRSYELTATAGKTLGTLVQIKEGDGGLRLFAETVNYYDNDPNAAEFAAHLGLTFGTLGRFGAVVRTEALVFTEDNLRVSYDANRPPYLNPTTRFVAGGDYPQEFADKLPSLAGYRYHPADNIHSGGWYAIAASSRFDFHKAQGTGRGLVLAQRDPLGNETTIEYDPSFDLLPIKVRDAMGNETTAHYNLRTLQPREVTDPNDNVTRLAYSPSGLVTDTRAMGKPSAPASDRRNAGDRTLPSVHLEYDLRAFERSRRATPDELQPVFIRAIRRVFHDSDPDDTGEIIEAREYSDGFGRLLQTRTQGEEVRFGNPHFGGGNDLLPVSQTAAQPSSITGQRNTDPANPNVVVSGWQRYDNKGRVIEKYEPFFDTGWQYDPPEDAQLGQKVVMFYDPRGQVIRTVNPDRSEQCVIYGVPTNLADPPLDPAEATKFRPTPWEAYTYDANDNAGRTPAADPGAAAYRHHWNTPASIKIDPLGRTIRAVARHRANLSSTIEEHVTRSSYDVQGNLTKIHDALGRLAFQYFYDLAKRPLRTESIDAGKRLAVFNAAGNPVETSDAKGTLQLHAKGALQLHAYDELNRPTHLWARDAATESVSLREKMFYGESADAPGIANDKRLNNLYGKLWKVNDEAGAVTTPTYDFKGNALISTRQVLSDDFMLSNLRKQTGPNWVLQAPRVNWSTSASSPQLETVKHETRSDFDALGRIKWSDYPACANGERYRLKPGFNRAGGLESVMLIGPLNANDQGPNQTYVDRIAYNAKGQRVMIAYGNEVFTRYAYDPKTFRLSRLYTSRYTKDQLTYHPTGVPLQDFAYGYDLGGNILGIKDRTPGCGVRSLPLKLNGPRLGPDALDREFEYDSLYRLTRATGREAAIPSPRPWYELPAEDRQEDVVLSGYYDPGKPPVTTQRNAPDLTSPYEETYAYDSAGNMLTMRHLQLQRSNGELRWTTLWSRHFGMGKLDPESWQQQAAGHLAAPWPNGPGNQLTHVQDRSNGTPTPPVVQQSHFYDTNGNMTGENTTRHFEWDHADRMKVFRDQPGTSAPSVYALYLYDSAGIRVKKLVWKAGNISTTIYLGAAFEHHKWSKNGQPGQTNHLHVMDNQSRVAILRVGVKHPDDGGKPVQYHLGDHLGGSNVVVGGATVQDNAFINREEFFPYGETSFGSFGRKRYRFTGKERDEESGLSYHIARYYATWLGRWGSCDPAGIGTKTILYAYALNNPLCFVDPHGTEENTATVYHRTDQRTGVGMEGRPPRTDMSRRHVWGGTAWYSSSDPSIPGYGGYDPGGKNTVIQQTISTEHMADLSAKDSKWLQDTPEGKEMRKELWKGLGREKGNQPNNLRDYVDTVWDTSWPGKNVIRHEVEGHSGVYTYIVRGEGALVGTPEIVGKITRTGEFIPRAKSGARTVPGPHGPQGGGGSTAQKAGKQLAKGERMTSAELKALARNTKPLRLTPTLLGIGAGLIAAKAYAETGQEWRVPLALGGIVFEPLDWIDFMIPDDPGDMTAWVRQYTIDWGPGPLSFRRKG